MQNNETELLEWVKKAEEISAHCQAEAGVYLNLLREVLDGIENAIKINNGYQLSFLLTKTREGIKASTVRTMGQNLLDEFYKHRAKVARMRKSLESVKVAAEKLEVEEGTFNANLKADILEAMEDGLNY
jgi:hypothetical protein